MEWADLHTVTTRPTHNTAPRRLPQETPGSPDRPLPLPSPLAACLQAVSILQPRQLQDFNTTPPAGGYTPSILQSRQLQDFNSGTSGMALADWAALNMSNTDTLGRCGVVVVGGVVGGEPGSWRCGAQHERHRRAEKGCGTEYRAGGGRLTGVVWVEIGRGGRGAAGP